MKVKEMLALAPHEYQFMIDWYGMITEEEAERECIEPDTEPTWHRGIEHHSRQDIIEYYGDMEVLEVGTDNIYEDVYFKMVVRE